MREILLGLLKVLLITTLVVVLSFCVWIFYRGMQPMEISEARGITFWPFFTLCAMLIAVEFFTTEGSRLVISPQKKGKLKSEQHASEGKCRKVSKLVEPLLGLKPRKVQVIEWSLKTSHEWFDLEIEAALMKLKIKWENWTDCISIWFHRLLRIRRSVKSQNTSQGPLTGFIQGLIKYLSGGSRSYQRYRDDRMDHHVYKMGRKEKGDEMYTIMCFYKMLKDRSGAIMAEYVVDAAVLILIAVAAFTSH